MLFLAVPQFSSNHDEVEDWPIHKLRQMIIDQREDVTLLCTIIEYLRGFIHVGLDDSEATKYNKKISSLAEHQGERFHKIDALINENILQIKKEKTTNTSVLTYGKEVRKLEAGLRTLRLFTCDVVEMLKLDSLVLNRSEERIRYFDTRSATLEVEMRMLNQKMSFL